MSTLTTDAVKTTDPNSPNPDSEYDTASDSPTDDDGEEEDDLHDDEEGELLGDSDGEFEDDEDGDDIILDLERQRGDGAEQDADGKKKDGAEDRSDPQYIPKKGTFYEHDDRTADDGVLKIGEANVSEDAGSEKQTKDDSPVPAPIAKPTKGWQKAAACERWSHDRFDENEQAPKSKAELVSAYGYDIRNEDGPPRARRRRRYGRGPNKYTRKWEDEGAYGKTTPQKMQVKPRPEDFPTLGPRSSKKMNPDDSHKENNSDEINKRYNRSYQSEKRSPSGRLRPGHKRDSRLKHNDRDRGFRRNTLEFKNQNRNKSSTIETQTVSIKVPSENQRNQVTQTIPIQPHITPVQLQQQYPPQTQSPPMESMSFTNTKLSSRNNIDIKNGEHLYGNARNSRERDYRPSNLAARLQQPMQNQVYQNQTQPTVNVMSSPNSTVIRNHQNLMMTNQNIPALNPMQVNSTSSTNNNNNTISNNSSNANVVLQQHMQLQQTLTQQLNNANNNNSISANNADISSRPKRYSSLRQKPTADSLPQQQQTAQSSQLHEQQILQLADQNLLKYQQAAQQQQQQQKSQTLPIHLQAELVTSNPKSGQPILGQSQSGGGNGQFNAAFYNSNTTGTEFAQTQVQPTAVVTQNASPQIIAGSQFPAQYQPAASGTYIQAPPGTYIPQTAAHPPPQPQIINYVPTQTQYPPPGPPQYSNYQNYNTVPPAITQPSPTSAIYQTQGGLTFYAPQTQTQPRPILPQRRPTNAIPIMAPPERVGKGRGRLINQQYEEYDETSQDPSKLANNNSGGNVPPLGSAENIDHILDNMFVQRPPYQPPVTRKSPPPPMVTPSDGGSTTLNENDDAIGEIEKSVKDLNINIKEDSPPVGSTIGTKVNETENIDKPATPTTHQADTVLIDQPA